MSVGMVAYLAVGVDSGASSTPAYSSSTVEFLPFTSENLDINREDLFSTNLVAIFDEEARYNGMQRPGGNVTAVMHHNLAGYLLRAFFDANTAANGTFFASTSHATVRNHVFTTKNTVFHCGSGSDLPTLTLEKYLGPCGPTAANVGSAFVFYNCAGNTLEMSIDAGGFARMSCDFLARGYGVKGNQVPTYKPPSAFLWSQCSVSLGGVGTTIYQNLTVRLENNIQGVPQLNGLLFPDRLKRQDFRRVSVNGTVTYENLTDYNRFVGGSQNQLLVDFISSDLVSTAGGPGGTGIPAAMEWDVPQFVYQSFPITAQGPGLIAIGFTGRGMLDPTSRYSLEVTIVTSRNSAYSVNAAS